MPLVILARYHVVVVIAEEVYAAVVAKPKSVQEVLSVDCCHWMLPTLPVKVTFPASPEQIFTSVEPTVEVP